MHGSLLYDLRPMPPSRTGSASPLVRLHCLRAGCTPDEVASLAVDAILRSISCGLWEETYARPFSGRRQDCCISRSTKALRSSAFTSETAQNANPSRSQSETL